MLQFYTFGKLMLQSLSRAKNILNNFSNFTGLWQTYASTSGKLFIQVLRVCKIKHTFAALADVCFIFVTADVCFIFFSKNFSRIFL